MSKILIFGAGSIGNHMAYASRKLKYNVSITDINPLALKRMKNIIYPTRYKNWDKSIKLLDFRRVFNQSNRYDLIIIGTPPHTHVELFNKIKKNLDFKNILIEKPLSIPSKNKFSSLDQYKNFKVYIGYNHSISKSFNYFLNIIKKIKKKNIKEINIKWCEDWSGIMNAHFWMKSEKDSYLSNFKQGGGSLQEHSHGMHLAKVISDNLKLNLFNKLSCVMFRDKTGNYDVSTYVSSFIDGILFSYHTNLISFPAQKNIIVKCNNSKYEWYCNYKKNMDKIIITNLKTNKIINKIFKKTRSSEFENELKYILNCSSYKYKNSPINIIKGISVQKTINNFAKYF